VTSPAAAAVTSPAAAAVTSPAAAAMTSPAAVSRSVGSRCEQCGSDETGNEKLHLHNNHGLFFYYRLFIAPHH
jgi:hypothetical protein